jgi:predicted acyltransferase
MKDNRFYSLDALRGVAILLMIFSGTIPFGGTLPAWMYHAQVPPPDHKFVPTLPGITWVDLVFPFFLFSMGAAFPFAYLKRLQSGISKPKIAGQILFRGFLLAFFAIVLQHFKPYAMNPSPTSYEWSIGLLGFVLMFFFFLKYPDKINVKISIAAKFLALALIVFILSFLQYKKGDSTEGFNLFRSDIIILVLANVAVSGGIIWLLTKDNILPRLAVLAFLLACRLTYNLPDSPASYLWNFNSIFGFKINWLYQFYFHQYLFIVIPGSIIGDLSYKYLYLFNRDIKFENKLEKNRLILFAFFSFAIIVLNVILLFSRALYINLFLSVLTIIILRILLVKYYSDISKFLKTFLNWGTFWLMLGLFFEAYEGGIKKDKSTLSYYFVTSGLAIFCLNFLIITIDIFKKRFGFKTIILSGQNPMIAYVGVSHLIQPIIGITGLSFIYEYTKTAFLGVVRGAMITWLDALIASTLSKFKIFWRT